MYAQKSEVSWDFPVKPGMEEWKSLKNSYEKINSCQIPNDVLPVLSTEQLVEICLRYPLLLDIMAFNNILDGFEKYKSDFNGFRELIKRKDATSILIQKYKETNPLAINKDWSSFEMIDYAIRISMMELILSDIQMLSKLEHIEKKDLMMEYNLKKIQKNIRIELYQDLGFQTIYLASVKLLESENINLSQAINMGLVIPYITSGLLISTEVTEQIDNAVNKYLSN